MKTAKMPINRESAHKDSFIERMIHMKKRTTILAAVMALTCISGTASMATNAEDSLVLVRDELGNISVTLEPNLDVPVVTSNEISYTYENPRFRQLIQASRGEGDQLAYHGESTGTCFYVVTDGTDLPMHHTFKTPCVHSKMDEDHEVQTYTESTVTIDCKDMTTESPEYPINAEELLAPYGPDAKLFELKGPMGFYPNSLYTLILENPHILNVYRGIDICDTIATVDRIVLNMHDVEGEDALMAPYYEQMTQNPDEGVTIPTEVEQQIEQLHEDFRKQVLGELYDEVTAFNDERDEWIQKYGDWRVSCDYVNMTPEERAASREAYGIESEWEMFERAMDIRDRVIERWDAYCAENDIDPDAAYRMSFPNEAVCSLGFITSSMQPAQTSVRAESLWTWFMDVNYDEKVDAADAAYILDKAANAGAYSASVYSADFDMNLDGKLNAADASELLIYLAEKGAGNAGSLEEYMAQNAAT